MHASRTTRCGLRPNIGVGNMYIWIGAKLPESFENEIRRRCLLLNRDIGLDTVAFSLPQHISLKISFQSERYQQIIDCLTAFLAEQKPVSLRILSPEQAGHILWMPVSENEALRQLHEQLDALLECRFEIKQHEFDKCFLFHSTLFMDPDTGKIAKMQETLRSYPVERQLLTDTFLLGLSESGKSGTYRVVREISL